MATIEAEHRTVAKPSCDGITKAGKPCRSPAVGPNGYCAVHDPNSPHDFAEIGRRGGRKSANAKRARHDLQAGRPVTELLRETFESDEAWLAAAVDAYRAGVSEGKPMDRVSVTNDLLARLYGKPQQLIQTKTETTINVVSRLGAALERATQSERVSHVDLIPSSVRELEA
jgi:hypothetical protein